MGHNIKKALYILAIILIFDTPSVLSDFEMTFEDFHAEGGINDGALIGTHYLGVRFESVVTGDDWVVADVTSGGYEASSWPSKQAWGNGWYWLYGYVGAWTGIEGESGKIIFNNLGVKSVQVGYSS